MADSDGSTWYEYCVSSVEVDYGQRIGVRKWSVLRPQRIFSSFDRCDTESRIHHHCVCIEILVGISGDRTSKSASC
jgi:hypothetical protein